jgi:N-acyl-L-homoserine lactone synthetase
MPQRTVRSVSDARDIGSEMLQTRQEDKQGRNGVITIGGRNELSPGVVSSMHEFRHEIFVRRLRWSLPENEGVERDEYDNERAVYFVVRDPADNVMACARLLPTTAPYMLADVFPQLLDNQPAPHDAAVWELSRFAADIRKTGEGRALAFSQPSMDLFEAIFDFARRNRIERLAVVTSIAIERLLLRSGFDVHRLGAPARTPDGVIVALYLEVHPTQERSTADLADTLSPPATPVSQ